VRNPITTAVTKTGRVQAGVRLITEPRRIARDTGEARVTESPLINLAITGDPTIEAALIGALATSQAIKRSLAI
jgi:hypothetical protein